MIKNGKIKLKSVLIIIPVITVILLKVFIIEIYKINSISMEPTLIPGDYILVNKMIYGTRLVQLRKFCSEKETEFIRIRALQKIKIGDVVIFNWPDYFTLNDPFPNIFGSAIVKRCYCVPGGTVQIKNNKGNELGRNSDLVLDTKADLFPHDLTLNWTLSDYGPLYVPAKEHSMILSKKNILWYKDILRFESPNIKIKDSTLVFDNKEIFQYTFRHNYYFMMGDNFYNSQDSRFWGFVPDENIIGKAALVLFSFNPDEKGFKKIHFERFFKFIR
jgi:signal peptidase I